MKTTAILTCLFALACTLATKAATMTITANPGVDVTVKFVVGAQNSEAGLVKSAFTFQAAKGVFGPSSNPASNTGFANGAKNLFAVTVSPATKSCFTHIFLTSKGANQILISDVNERVSKLLPQPWRDDAQNFLRVEKLQGRKLTLQTMDFAHAPFKSHTFRVLVDAQGGITLAP